MDLQYVLQALERARAAGDTEAVAALTELAQTLGAQATPVAQAQPKTGLGAAFGKGLESLISSGRTTFGALTGSPEAAAQAGLERGQQIGDRYADQVSLDRVEKAYEEQGLLPAAGEALSQVPAAIAEQIPNLVATIGGARLGRMAGARLGAMAGAPFGPVGATIGGIGGALMPSLIQQFGGNIERQAQEGAPISTGSAAAAAVPQAALNVASQAIPLGGRLVQKLTGVPVAAFFSKSAAQAEKIANERLLTTLAKGTAVGALAEIPTEVAQQMLERAQAGLSLTSPDALREYGETAYQVSLLAPIGAAGRYMERGGARLELQEQQARQQQEAAQAAAAQKQAYEQSEDYLRDMQNKATAYTQQMQQMQAAASVRPEPGDVRGMAEAANAKQALKDFENGEEFKSFMAAYRKALPQIKALEAAQQPPVATPAEPTAPAEQTPLELAPIETATPMPEAPAAAPAEAVKGPQFMTADELVAYFDAQMAGKTPTQAAPAGEAPAPAEVKPKKAKKAAPAVAEPAVAEPAVAEPTPVAKKQRAKKQVAPAVATPAVAEPAVAAPAVAAPVEETSEETAIGQRVLPGFEQPSYNTFYPATSKGERGVRASEQQLQEELRAARREGRDEDVADIINEIKALRAEQKGRYNYTEDFVEERRLVAHIRQSRETGDNSAARAAITKLRELRKRRAALTGSEKLSSRPKARQTGLFDIEETPVTLPEEAANIRQARVSRQKIEQAALKRAMQGASKVEGTPTPVTVTYTDTEREALRRLDAEIEQAGGTREVSAEDLTALLSQYEKRKDLSANEKFLLDEVRGAESRIMDDPEAREIVAEWLDTDVGKGVGDATRYLRKYLGIDAKKREAIEKFTDALEDKGTQEVTRVLATIDAPSARLTAANKNLSDTITQLRKDAKPEVRAKLNAAGAKIKQAATIRDLLKALVDTPASMRDERQALQVLFRKALQEAGFTYTPSAPKSEERLAQRTPRQAELFEAEKTTSKEAAPFKPEQRAAQAARDKEQQKLLEGRERIPGRRVSFEQRRAAQTAREQNAARIASLEAMANDARLSEEERAAAREQAQELRAKRLAEAEKQDESYEINVRLLAEERAKLKELRAEMDTDLLNKKEQAQVVVATKRSAEEGAALRKEKEAPKKAKLQARIDALEESIAKRERKLSRDGGVTVEPIPTAEERKAQLEQITRETRAAESLPKLRAQLKVAEGKLADLQAAEPTAPKAKKAHAAQVAVQQAEVDALADIVAAREADLDVFASYTKGQTTQRVKSPTLRTTGGGPSVFQTGDIETRVQQQGSEPTTRTEATRTRTTRLTEDRSIRQRNVPISKKEMEAANMGRKSVQQELLSMTARADILADNDARISGLLPDLRRRLQWLKDNKKPVDDQKKVTAQITSLENEQKAIKRELDSLKPFLRGVSGANDTPLSTTNADMLQAGDITSVLLNLANKSTNPVARRVAKKLAAVTEVNGVSSQVVEVTTKAAPDAPGAISRDGLRTYFNQHTGMSEESVIHEAAHAATMFELDKPNSALTPDQRAAKSELNRMMKAAKASPDLKSVVISEGDLHEFVSEGLGSRAVQEYMRNTEWDGRPLWRRFIDAILRLLRVSTPPKGPMLDRFLDLADKFIQAKETGAVVKGEGKYRASASTYTPAFKEEGAIADKAIAQQRDWSEPIKRFGSGLAFETQFVDRFAPLERVSRTMEPLRGSQMMYYVRMYDSQMHHVSEAALHGAPDLVQKVRPDGRTEYLVEAQDGPSLAKVAETLLDAKDIVGSADGASNLFSMYLAGIRAQNKGFDVLQAGSLYTKADLERVMQKVEGNAALKRVFDEAKRTYNEYNANLLRFAVKTGAFSQELVDRLLKDNDYIPYYRQRNGNAELLIGNEPPIKIGNLKDQPQLQALVGGDRPILNFLDSAVQNTHMMLNMSLGNLAKKNAMNELAELGMATITDRAITGPKVVMFKDKGDERYAMVDTPDAIPADLLVKGMEGIPTQYTGLMHALTVPARVLRKAVVLSPLYAARQVVRDSLGAVIGSGADMAPVIGSVAALRSASRKTLERRGIVGGQVFTGSNEDLSKVLRDITQGKPGYMKLIGKLEALSMSADAATRVGQYDSYRKQGLSDMEATLMSLESMNFSKRGLSPTAHFMNAVIPFFNSQVQSLNVLYKAMTGQMPFSERLQIQKKMLARGLLLAGATMAYAAMMQDDEAYKNAPPEVKYGNWFLRLPGVDEPVRIPIPFEIGYIFKALPEALYNSMADEHGADEALKAFRSILLNTVPGGGSYFLPQAIKPAIEAKLGTSFYTGRPVLSAREARLLPEAQYRESTSEGSKALGEALGISPIMLDNLINGYTSGLGLALWQATTSPFADLDTPDKAVKRLSDMPIVGGAFQPNDARGILDAVFEDMSKYEKAQSTLKDYLDRGERAKAQQFMQTYADDIAKAQMAGKFTQVIGELSKYERAIKASDKTPEEKREMLDRVQQMKIRFAATLRAADDRTKPP